ncbi:MAG: hypothetical protein ACLRVT_03960 [Oscillospiraceae bacterium]
MSSEELKILKNSVIALLKSGAVDLNQHADRIPKYGIRQCQPIAKSAIKQRRECSAFLFFISRSGTSEQNRLYHRESARIKLRRAKSMDFWDGNSQADWLLAEGHYWDLVKETDLERRMEALCSQEVKNMNTEEFFDFLFYEYFVWKYTAKNRLATTRKQLQKHRDTLSELKAIQKALFSFDLKQAGLRTAAHQRPGPRGPLTLQFFPNQTDQPAAKSLAQFVFLSRSAAENQPDSTMKKSGVFNRTVKGKAQE